MDTVPIHYAKTHLSRLIERARAGEEVIISRGKTPVVRLVPIAPSKEGRVFGAMRDLVTVDDSFFEPLSDEELARWEGQA